MHRRQVEPVAVLGGERYADDAAGVADRERDEFGGGPLGGEDQVALVLTVLVVDHDDRAAGGDVGDRAFDGGGAGGDHAVLTCIGRRLRATQSRAPQTHITRKIA